MSYKKDKKILFACDRILDNYVDEMRKGFENQGYDVTFIDKNGLILDRKNKLKIKIIKYLNLEKILKKSMNNYYKNNIKIYKNYDAVLSIGGGELSNLLIETVKKYSPNIKFVKFIWDTADLKYIQNIKKIYDKIYTFEKSDAEKYKINFRTSFFIDNEFVLWDKKNIDCYYLGAIRDNKRYNYVNKLYEYCKKNNLKSKLILYIKNKYRKLEHKNKNILTNKKLEYRDNIDFIKKSKVVLELNYSNQKGLTLRTLETIGGEQIDY